MYLETFFFFFFLLLRLSALSDLEPATGLKVVSNILLAQLKKPCAQKQRVSFSPMSSKSSSSEMLCSFKLFNNLNSHPENCL
jgi:hypothetical protein